MVRFSPRNALFADLMPGPVLAERVGIQRCVLQNLAHDAGRDVATGMIGHHRRPAIFMLEEYVTSALTRRPEAVLPQQAGNLPVGQRWDVRNQRNQASTFILSIETNWVLGAPFVSR